jgi:hypothetical protein
VKESKQIKMVRVLIISIATLFLAVALINCGGGSSSSSAPAQVKAPVDLIKDFIAKQTTMIDKALANFYTKEEQPTITAEVEKNIETKSAAELEKLKNTTFDFSNVKIAVVGEKETTYEYNTTKIIKVSVNGNLVMNQAGTSTEVPADRTIILERVDNSWKVTEKNDPWKEYHYKNS